MKQKYRYNYEYEHGKLDMNNAADRAKARVGFKIHLVVYISVIAFLWVIAFLTGTVWRHPWPIYPMMGWGIGLMGHYFAAYRKYNKWLEHEMEKEGITPPQYLPENEEQFELKPLKNEREVKKMPRDTDFI